MAGVRKMIAPATTRAPSRLDSITRRIFTTISVSQVSQPQVGTEIRALYPYGGLGLPQHSVPIRGCREALRARHDRSQLGCDLGADRLGALHLTRRGQRGAHTVELPLEPPDPACVLGEQERAG